MTAPGKQYIHIAVKSTSDITDIGQPLNWQNSILLPKRAYNLASLLPTLIVTLFMLDIGQQWSHDPFDCDLLESLLYP